MTTEYNGWKRPGMKQIDGYKNFNGEVATFIKNTALRFLQVVYSQKQDMRYEDDEEKTNIKIADQYAFQLSASDTRPAIIAVRGTMNWQGVSMGMGVQEVNTRTGSKEFTDLIIGSVGFSCLSRVGLEAEQIASEVFNLFKFFRPTLMKHGFFNIRSMSIGPEQLIEAPGEPSLFLVSVLMTCQVQDRWVLEPKTATELKKIIVEALTDKDDGEEIQFFRTEITNDQGGT